MGEKEFLIALLDKEINNSDDNNSVFFENILLQIENNNAYKYDFVIALTDALIKILVRDLNDKESFLSSFNALKEKIINSKNENTLLVFTDEENDTLNKFIELIRENANKKGNPVLADLKARLSNNKQLNSDDYDIIERLIYKYEVKNPDKEFEQAMDYLNRYNLPLIRRYGKEPKKKVEYTKVDENTNIKEEVIEEKVSDDFDPFKAVSFNVVPKERSRTNRKKRIKEANIEEEKKINSDVSDLLSQIQIDYNKFPKKDILNKPGVLEIVKYLADNDVILSEERLINLVLCIDGKTFNHYISLLKDKYNLTDISITDLIIRYTDVFEKDNFVNFEDNMNLLGTYCEYDINIVINKCLEFFYNKHSENVAMIEQLVNFGLDISKLVNDNVELLGKDFCLIKNNVRLLEIYGYDIKEEKDYTSLSLLSTNNLERCLDRFVELGLNEYIHSDPSASLKMTKSLCIKTIFYAYKNGLVVWKNENAFVDAETYDKYETILQNKKILDESEISLLIYEHPILELIEEGHRMALFKDTFIANIKRKTELRFNAKIISRIKTYSIFKALIDQDIKEEDAIIFAITYNTELNRSEYDEIRKIIYRNIGVSGK